MEPEVYEKPSMVVWKKMPMVKLSRQSHVFATDGSGMIKLLTRYQSYKKTEELTRVSLHKNMSVNLQQKLDSENVCTADELTQMIKWQLEENNIKLLDTTGLNQLEQQLDSLLHQVRTRKVSSLVKKLDSCSNMMVLIKRTQRISLKREKI
ncbi:hypothetical protein OSB04_026844 [Centaurea solstitialis]|uniref:Uncharacterized protein n=1 Tax=Centaurea solstitialis TaxID=347529 RepID=A0AA38SXN9_9ASTR|nr:hypothetical protein OSB04_026844 [Centaurea solstitialis]